MWLMVHRTAAIDVRGCRRLMDSVVQIGLLSQDPHATARRHKFVSGSRLPTRCRGVTDNPRENTSKIDTRASTSFLTQLLGNNLQASALDSCCIKPTPRHFFTRHNCSIVIKAHKI
ncbi:hypothetical protein J6590_009707 [Homalodisca vitripennis]|nr:hypothetical protein J6590_009707 [Homalodisca vitripennis]